MKQCDDIRKELAGILSDLPKEWMEFSHGKESENDVSNPFKPSIRKHLASCKDCKKWVHQQQKIIRLSACKHDYEWSESRKKRLLEAILTNQWEASTGKSSQSGNEINIGSGSTKPRSKSIVEHRPLRNPHYKVYRHPAFWPTVAASLIILFLGYRFFVFTPSEQTTEQLPDNPLAQMEQFLERSERFLMLVNELEDHWEITDSVKFSRHAQFAEELRDELGEIVSRYSIDVYPLTHDLFVKLEFVYTEASFMNSQITKSDTDLLVQSTSDHALLTRIRLLRAHLQDELPNYADMEVSL